MFWPTVTIEGKGSPFIAIFISVEAAEAFFSKIICMKLLWTLFCGWLCSVSFCSTQSRENSWKDGFNNWFKITFVLLNYSFVKSWWNNLSKCIRYPHYTLENEHSLRITLNDQTSRQTLFYLVYIMVYDTTGGVFLLPNRIISNTEGKFQKIPK